MVHILLREDGTMKQHRFVLIGHGSISRTYVNTISQIKQAEIVGVVGRDEGRVKAYAADHNIAVYGTQLEEVARKSAATAVIIVTPNALHNDAVIEAARLGLHCLCEKPLDIDPAKQLEMIEACRRHGVKLGVSYMRRFAEHIQYVKEVIDSGQLGRVMIADVTLKHYRAKEYYDSWHGTYAMDGGGPFIQQGSHMVDMVLWLCGGYDKVINATRFQVYHDIETEDHGYALVQYDNGAIGMIEASTASYGITKDVIEISGTKGSIAVNYDEIISFDVQGVAQPHFEKRDNSDNFKDLITDFMEAIEQDKEPFINGESAKRATELVVEIYEKSGDPIKTTSN